MDLTPQTSTPWWSLLSCCRPPASSEMAKEEEVEEDDGYVGDITPTITAPTALKVVTNGKLIIVEVADPCDTPATACTNISVGKKLCPRLYYFYAYHVTILFTNGFISAIYILFIDTNVTDSFESDVDDFIGEITMPTPKPETPTGKKVTFEDDIVNEQEISTSHTPSFFATLSPEKLVELVEEKEGDKSNVDATNDDSNSEMSDPDEGDYWYSRLVKDQSPMRKKEGTDDVPEIDAVELETQQLIDNETEDGDDDYDVPEIDSQSIIAVKSLYSGTMDNVSSATQQQEDDQLGIKFYQFMILMMLRHMFGSWLPEDIDPSNSFFNNSELITDTENENKSETEKKEYRKKMTLRTLQYKDSKVEVVPQLKREDEEIHDSLNDVPVI